MGLINYLIQQIANVIGFFLDILPDSPFSVPAFNHVAQYVGYVNYFFPVGQALAILTTWLAAIAVWYGVRYVLRLLRYIS